MFLQTAMSPSTAQSAAAGWTGDQTTVWNDGTRYCIRVWYVTPADPHVARLLKNALRQWVRTHAGAKLEAEHLGINRCV